MNLNFNTGVPAAANNPSTDQNPMQVNNASNAAIWNVDHFGFGNNLGGWHNVIHIPQITGNTDPAATTVPANAGQVYTRTIGGDLQLFYESSGGIISQLTTPGVTPSANLPGYSYLPGGVIFQWGNGISTGASPNVSVTFPLTFPSAIFNIQMLPLEASNSRRLWHLNSNTTAGFTAYLQDTNGASVVNAFYWMALGK